MYELQRNQSQKIQFVLVDVNWLEVPGLGGTFTLDISKAGAAFQASTGAKAEVGSGWYTYELSAAETDTVGPLAIKITAPGTVQQNLVYVIETFNASCIEYTYVVTNHITGLPEEGVQVWFATDNLGTRIVWVGTTDTFGIARDATGELPLLDPGTYYIWRQKAGFSAVNPDTEIVS